LNEDRSANVEVPNAPPHHHAVHVYADDLAIGHELVRFIEDGLALGQGVVIAANSKHLARIAAWRSDHPSISGDDYLVVVDAAEMLPTLMVAGSPDPVRFNARVGPILERAARGGRTVRVFGEMVALLWADGNVTGALALEALWNDLASNRRFFLLCAYPEALLVEAPLGAVNAMCEHHSDLSLLGHLMQFAGANTATPSHNQRLLIPVPTAVSAARQTTIQTLVEWELSQLLQKCGVVASELAANAVEHAESSFRLVLSRDASTLRIAVEDAAVGWFPTEGLRADSPIGSGLAKVQSIASDWGCDVTPGGKTVWAELPI
jgi:MEDS: MEthanogen/methylotroph, DcmR Sensory domain